MRHLFFEQFEKNTKEHLSEYFSSVWLKRESYTRDLGPNQSMVCPAAVTFMRFGQNYFGFELHDVSDGEPFKRRHRRSYKSVEAYFDLFEQKSCDVGILVQGDQGQSTPTRGQGLSNVCLSQTRDLKAVERRFATTALSETWITLPEFEGPLVSFDRNVQVFSCEWVNAINASSNVFRCRHIWYLLVISTTLSSSAYKEVLRHHFPLESGRVLSAVAGLAPKQLAALKFSSFQNLYLDYRAKENDLVAHLKAHESDLCAALGAKRIIFHPRLQDQIDKTVIIPDMIVVRTNGDFDIYDFKLALLGKVSLVRGAKNRRRFIAELTEGLAQLAHYKAYFEREKNSEYAFQHFGIRAVDTKLGLIVGSWENLDAELAVEALRPYRDNYSILDYDTLTTLLIASADIGNQKQARPLA